LKNNILIDIYSDTVCPWCYIGLIKLKSAMKESQEIKFDLTWRPFQLNPDMPASGMDRKKYLTLKFDGIEKSKKIYKNIYEEGVRNGIHFQFEKILKTPHSFASHKLLALAYKYGKQTEIVETLFYDYFIEGVDIGNFDQLIRIAKLHNIFKENTLEYLKSNKDKENLLQEEKHARSLGVKGVPCFIVNKEFVLFGAQEKNKFLDIFKNIINVS